MSENDKGKGQPNPGGNPHEVTIIVNGRPREVSKDDFSFEDLVTLAFDNPLTGPNVLTTITYTRGHGNKPEGTLQAGESVKVKEGMVFVVKQSDKS